VFAGLLNKGLRGSIVLVIALFVVTFFASYFSSVILEENNYPNLFYNYFTARFSSRLFITLVNYLLIAIGLFLISLIGIDQEIVDKVNYFPVFIYLLLGCVSVNPGHITPQLFTNVFVLFAMYKLLDSYRHEQVLRQIFDAALWLCVSAFITISSIVFFPLFFIALLILRPFNWREWAVALLGFFVPVYFYESMAYLSNFNQWYLFNSIGLYFTSFSLPSPSEYYIALLVILFLLLFISILYNFSRGFGNTVKKQRTKSILMWFLLFSTFGFFSGGATGSSIISTFAFPISFLVGDFLFNVRQLKITNTILTILILSAMVVFMAQLGAI
jgi:hypothetical protein